MSRTPNSTALDFEAMFRSAPSAYVVVRPDAPLYTIADVNTAYLEGTKKRRQDLVGRPLFEAFPVNPDDPHATGVANIRHSLDTVLRTGAQHVIAAQRYDILGPDGTFEEHYWKLVSAPLFDAEGNITHITHRVEDVTAYQILAAARTRAESERERLTVQEAAALSRAEEAEDRLHRVYQQAPVAMALLSGPDHVVEFANRRYREIVGHRPIRGLPIREALPELGGQDIFEVLDSVFASRRPHHAFERAVRLDRGGGTPEERFFNVMYQPLLDENGATEGIAVVATDVTELVSAREEARKAAADRDAERRQLLTALNQSPLGIVIAEAPSGRLVFANSRAGEIYGRSRLSSGIEEYSADWGGFHRNGRSVEPEEWPLARAIMHGETVENEVVLIEHTKGHRVEITIKAAPVRDDEGRIIAGVAVFWDVTAERRTERQLREAQRLQAVGTLAGGVAHEVNNQMTVVLGFGEFVLRELGPEHAQAADQRLVLQAADRAARVTQQLLAFSRQQINQPRVLDLRELADGLRPVLQQLLGSDKDLVIAPRRPKQRVNVDPSQVEQVLINLIANARDATCTGGNVTISVEDADVSDAPVAGQTGSMAPGPYVALTVTDSGSGIDADTIARIFEPFFTTKPVGQGTGLGLSMVYGIVKQHGGYIWANSQPGEGTAMRLYWPAVPSIDSAEDDPSAGDGEETPRPQPCATVLVVEDEAAVRQLASRSLELAGFTVIAAEDGEAALEVIRSGGPLPDLLLTDVVMPHVSGRQLSEAVAEMKPDLPVLFISGYAGDDVVLRQLVPEGAAFLQKPFTPDQLVESVSALMARRQRESPRPTP